MAKAGRVADNEREVRDVSRHDRTSTHHCKPTNRHSSEDSGICADATSLLEKSSQKLRTRIPAAGSQIIRKAGCRTDENVVLHLNAIPQGYAAFKGDAVPETDLAFDESVIANVAVFSYDRTPSDVSKGPDPSPRPNVYSVINESVRMHKNRFVHDGSAHTTVLGVAKEQSSFKEWRQERSGRTTPGATLMFRPRPVAVFSTSKETTESLRNRT